MDLDHAVSFAQGWLEKFADGPKQRHLIPTRVPMPPTPPFWVLQRQVKIEPVSEETLRLTAPNLPPYEVGVKSLEGGWVGHLTRPATGEGAKTPLAESDRPLPSVTLAWDAAFELYRQHVIV